MKTYMLLGLRLKQNMKYEHKKLYNIIQNFNYTLEASIGRNYRPYLLFTRRLNKTPGVFTILGLLSGLPVNITRKVCGSVQPNVPAHFVFLRFNIIMYVVCCSNSHEKFSINVSLRLGDSR